MFPNINAECGRRGWSKAELARQLGVSYSTVKNWMRGTNDIPCSYVVKMASLFNVSCDYLLGLRQVDGKGA